MKEGKMKRRGRWTFRQKGRKQVEINNTGRRRPRVCTFNAKKIVMQ